MSQTQAFLSYTRIDDEFFGGAITALRSALELGVRVVTGNKAFEIFQDIDGIELGEQWQKRLGEALSDASFLIPIITPLFFSSDACRSELAKFINHEKASGRDDLILPIYFVTTPLLEKADQLTRDALALEISKRQRRDWRPHADLPINDPKIRREIRNLSEQIARAIGRTDKKHDVRLSPTLEKSREAQFQANSELIIEQTRSEQNVIAPKRILWVDDRPDNNIYERAAMERYNINFVIVKSTDEAIAKLSNTQFDAIISDMGRPPDRWAGYTLLEAVRSSGNQTPYFIYAGSRAPDHIAESRRRGAQGTTNSPAELIGMVIAGLRTEIGNISSQVSGVSVSKRDKVFISYSHKDPRALDELITMLVPAMRTGKLDPWSDTKIPPGAKWEDEIKFALGAAKVAVLLVTQNFLASDFIAKDELPPLLKAAKSDGVTIFWIYWGSCLYKETEIAQYQAAHDVTKPLSQLTKPKRQQALRQICEKLIRAVHDT
jgi:CheY-like chemotaxis protein